jgi:hypothetical protein
MTKAAKAKRRRAARERMQQMGLREQRIQHGGTHIRDFTFAEINHAELSIAHRLDCTIILRPNYAVTNGWRAYAVKA